MRFHDLGFFRAAMAAAALTATADGVLSECELRRALDALDDHPRLKPFGRAAAEGALRSFVQQIAGRSDGLQSALIALDAIYGDDGAAAAVMSLARAVCESDGALTRPEMMMLAMLRDRLGVEEIDPLDDASAHL